ncbi:hypothetical protein Godav_004246 [Gossypium davidsonii]|uniref:Uncharacterized protein n=1 Tax=Gossypium davidsonii TaxID=34287 RepID=A0A7J8SL88_GOSDV|nr:hypothetical protein [Gossypium davidsonii]
MKPLMLLWRLTVSLPEGALQTRRTFHKVYQLDLYHEGQEDCTYFLTA